MAWNVLDIQNQIASEVDQSDSSPDQGSTDWNIRLNYINRAQLDWAKTYDWSALLKVHNGVVTNSGNATYPLPSDFEKVDSYVHIVADGRTTFDFPVDSPSRSNLYSSSDKWVSILGNYRDNRVMYINSNVLVSGASLSFTYYSSPASLATSSHIVACPDPSFLVQRALYYIHKSNEDGRFPEAKVESDKILARMIENENTLPLSHMDRSVRRGIGRIANFRIGRD